jgi:hypothetical protein
MTKPKVLISDKMDPNAERILKELGCDVDVITGKTLGLIGAGNIGSIVASRALGLRMKVIAYDPFLTEERAV